MATAEQAVAGGTVPRGWWKRPNNLGMVDVGPDGGHCNFMVRPLIDSGSRALADEIASLFALSGSGVEIAGHYLRLAVRPGFTRCWRVGPGVGVPPGVRRRIDGAGDPRRPECGPIAARYPAWTSSPSARRSAGAHAPGERVEIESVGGLVAARRDPRRSRKPALAWGAIQ